MFSGENKKYKQKYRNSRGNKPNNITIMTAGLIIGQGSDAGPAAAALRPHARVLLRSKDGHDVADVLRALRA